jgi:hypothetical protein
MSIYFEPLKQLNCMKFNLNNMNNYFELYKYLFLNF